MQICQVVHERHHGLTWPNPLGRETMVCMEMHKLRPWTYLLTSLLGKRMHREARQITLHLRPRQTKDRPILRLHPLTSTKARTLRIRPHQR